MESRSVIRNAKNARGLGRVVRVLISLLIRPHYVYYLRAWHRLIIMLHSHLNDMEIPETKRFIPKGFESGRIKVQHLVSRIGLLGKR